MPLGSGPTSLRADHSEGGAMLAGTVGISALQECVLVVSTANQYRVKRSMQA